MNYHWNWGIFFETAPDGTGTYLDMLLMGLRWTLATSGLAWIIALVAGLLVGVPRTFARGTLGFVCAAYVELFRNIPILVQLFLWYFVLPELLPRPMGLWLKTLPNAAFWTASIGLGLFMSARIAEQVKAGVEALPRGQAMAGAALGMTRAKIYRYVLLPMALRIMLPPLTSEMLNTVKNSSVALTIGLMELTGSARAMQEFSFQVFEAFTAATLIYLALNVVITMTMRQIERRLALPGQTAGR